MVIPHHRVVIVGTGFSGLGMAVRLAQRGETTSWSSSGPTTWAAPGGTTATPGCACDVPSRLYSFSFDQKPDWSRDYATAPEIWAYLRGVADATACASGSSSARTCVARSTTSSTGAGRSTAADGRRWTPTRSSSGSARCTSRGCPDIPGLEGFAGDVIHTARWPDAGRARRPPGRRRRHRRQLGPARPRARPARRAHHGVPAHPGVDLPKRDRPWSDAASGVPPATPLSSGRSAGSPTGAGGAGPALRPLPASWPGWQSVSPAASSRRRSATRRCGAGSPPTTRWAASGSCSPATTGRPSTATTSSLVTGAIGGVEPDAVVTADGARHEVDADRPRHRVRRGGSYDRIGIRGLGGPRPRRRVVRGGQHSHLGITVAGFPELYLLLGPNTGLGHSSVVMMTEFATRYVLQGLDRARSGARVDTSAAAQDAFTDEMQAAHPPHGVGDRLQELVPRQVRPQHRDLARVDHRLLVADPHEWTTPSSSPCSTARRAPPPALQQRSPSMLKGVRAQGQHRHRWRVRHRRGHRRRARRPRQPRRAGRPRPRRGPGGGRSSSARGLGRRPRRRRRRCGPTSSGHRRRARPPRRDGQQRRHRSRRAPRGARRAALEQAIDVNLRGVVNGVTRGIRGDAAQGCGHILNTASLAGLIPAPSMLPYTTTKHAVVGLSTALRAEAARRDPGERALPGVRRHPAARRDV